MASMLQYRAVVEGLARRQDLDVLAYDWLGCGASPKPREWEAYSTPNLVADLVAAYEMLLGPEGASDGIPTVLVGHSFGTSLAMQVAADLAAGRATNGAAALPPPAALCLMAAGDGESASGKTSVFHLPELCLRWLQPTMSAAFARMALHAEADDSVKAESQAISAANEMHVCKAFYRQMEWCQPAGNGPALPALFVHGEDDGVLPVEEGRRVAACFGDKAVFRTVVRASHQLMMEQPAEVVALLEALINNVAAGRDALSGL